ncbi:MAG TPA: hypothetical protein VIC26_12945 [Marinagarivorans sp.]
MNVMKISLYSTVLFACLYAGISQAQGQYYRYVNEDGVKVLGHSIPPKYVKNGYEIVSRHGRVIEVVEPAPDPEFVEQERAKAELRAQYELLARRYSTVRDIEAARQRKLIHVDASILLVESSIENIQEEIDGITTRAAEFERAGRAVPKNILDTLAALNEKMAATRAIRDQRLEEKKIIDDRFARELRLFTQGAADFEGEYTASEGTEQDLVDAASKASGKSGK